MLHTSNNFTESDKNWLSHKIKMKNKRLIAKRTKKAQKGK